MATNWKRTLVKFLTWFFGLFVVYIIIVLIHGTLTDYQPEDKTALEPLNRSTTELLRDSVFSFTIWNIGYAGLGKESELFYDSRGSLIAAGKMIRAPRQAVDKNLQAAANLVTSIKSDFFLFQEIDVESKRSYYTDQVEVVAENLPDFSVYFAPNFNVRRMPIPILEPWHVYGKAHSGLGTFARFQPRESERLSLPGTFSWPTRVFQLDRCAALHRFSHKNGKDLVVVNIHLSAYDQNGGLKKAQMDFLRAMVLEEYKRGNYVVVGGDWNQCPPYFQFDGFMPGRTQGYSQINIDPSFLPSDWRWVYDPTVPTNRKTKTPYQPGETFVTLIDFFLISPNLKVRSVKGLNQGFQFSDHQPVWMEVALD